MQSVSAHILSGEPGSFGYYAQEVAGYFEQLGRSEAIFTPLSERMFRPSEVSKTLELAIASPTDQQQNREDEYDHSEQLVHKTFTMTETWYFDQGDARAEAEILKDKVIVSKYFESILLIITYRRVASCSLSVKMRILILDSLHRFFWVLNSEFSIYKNNGTNKFSWFIWDICIYSQYVQTDLNNCFIHIDEKTSVKFIGINMDK